MKRKFCGILVCLVVFVSGVTNIVRGESDDVSSKTEDANDETDIFRPTDYWQEVKKGQPIPQGLHVRMNVYTGKTEAKLLEQEPAYPRTSSRTDIVAVTEDEDVVSEQPYMSKEELKRVLGQTGEDGFSEDYEDVSKKFRSYEELKKDFGYLNLAVKTDLELLSELTEKAKQLLLSKVDDDDALNVLTDLEYLVHQIDNGREFIRLGGLTDVVLPALNVSSAKVRAEALWLLGSAVQSNPKVQIAALEAGSVQVLVRSAVLDEDETVRTRAIYALSCLVRHFAAAQAKLISSGGLSALAKVFDSERSGDLKTKVKIITLITDLVLEHKEVESAVNQLSAESSQNYSNTSSSAEDTVQKMYQYQRRELAEKHRQYRSIGLERHLLGEGWCGRLSQFLVRLQRDSISSSRSQHSEDLGSILSRDVPFRPEHDVIEKVAGAMGVMSGLCIEQFQADSDLIKALPQLITSYQSLALQEEIVWNENNFNDVNNQCSEEECRTVRKKDVVDQDLEFYYSTIAEKLAVIAKLIDNPAVVPRPSKEEL